MTRKLLFVLIAFVFVISLVGVNAQTSQATTQAQAVNLLTDPGFEGPNGYYAASVDPLDPNLYFTIPRNWGGIVNLAPRNKPWQNAHPSGYPHTAGFKHGGDRSLHIARGFATFSVTLHQRVSVQPGSPLQGGVWAYMDTAEGLVRVGIDPNGGINPGAGGVVWSGWVSGANTWHQPSVSGTANGGTATLFIQLTQNQPSDPNGTYIDDAFLNGIPGDGTIADPPPTTGTTTGDTSGGSTGGSTTTSTQLHVTSNVHLRVRSGPSTSNTRIGTILPGQSFPYVAQVGEWYQIDYNGQTGYVAGWIGQIITGPAGGSSSSGGGAGGTLTANYRLNVRGGPSTNFAPIGHINAGEQRTIIGSQDGWYSFDYNGQTGYVAGWLVTVR